MNKQILRIDQQQAERLAELGQHLSHLRQNQAITLEQVAEKTLIPVRILAAIEAGKVDHLPEPVYVQGFIRRFADAIGVNGVEFANAFPAEAEAETTTSSWRGTVQAQLRPLHLYVLYIGLVVCAISGLSLLLNRSTPQMNGLTSTAQSPAPELPVAPGMVYGPMLPGVPLVNGNPSALPSPAADTPQKPVRVDLTLTAQSWLRIVVDGKTDFEGVLPEGTKRSWAADKQVTLRAGNAGGVMVSFNDGQTKRLGAPGEVEEVTFKPNSSQASSSSSGTSMATLPTSSAVCGVPEWGDGWGVARAAFDSRIHPVPSPGKAAG